MISSFSGNLGFPVETGHILVIGGRTIDSASRLDINLAGGKIEGSELPLHISVRFDEDIIVRNTKTINQNWGIAEREGNLIDPTITNPLIAGESFKIYILIGENKFHISINEHSYCTYKFRLPLNEIRVITVNKDVQSINQIDHRQIYPIHHPLLQFDDVNVMFSNDLPKIITPGHVMIITGIPYGNPKGSFIMRFTEKENIKKQALHFNPRFETNVVVRTTTTADGSYDKEERHGGFPFVLDQQFKIAFAFTDNSFKFAVNGQMFTEFLYRSQNILPILNGFKCYCISGMQLEITSIDHLNMGVSDCEGFETYSDPDVQLL